MWESEKLCREAVSALNAHDVAAAVASFAPDGVVIDYSDPTIEHRGHGAIAAVIEGFFALLPDLSTELLDVVASETRVAAEAVLRGTPVGQSQPIEVPCCLYYVVQNDGISSEHAYFDPAALPKA